MVLRNNRRAHHARVYQGGQEEVGRTNEDEKTLMCSYAEPEIRADTVSGVQLT